MKAIIVLAVVFLISGCGPGLLQKRHNSRIQELDHLYNSGQIDAVQYQTKYAEAVEDYSVKRSFLAQGLISQRKSR